MGRILSLVLGLGVVAFIAYKVMYGSVAGAGGGAGATPPQRLKEANEAAKRIEVQQQERADDALTRPAAGGE